jgi:ABC-type lipoprotein release transport system permease subunit
MISELLLLVQLAARNLWASTTNVVMGLLIMVGTFLVMTGNALLQSVDQAMSRSVAGSVAGEVQVYSSESEDELTLWGAPDVVPEIAPAVGFPHWKKTLEAVPNVKSVVPMGLLVATLSSGNTLDLALGDLRLAINASGSGDAAQGAGRPVPVLKERVRQMLRALQEEIAHAREMVGEQSYDAAQLAALDRASAPTFWEQFDQAPYDSLELLENQVAPLMADPMPVFIRFLGTDLDVFQRSFDRMKIVDGQSVPPGRRGALLSKLFYEDTLKLKTARRLDLIHEALGRGESIASSPDLQRRVEENQSNTRELLFQLDAQKSQELAEQLRRELGSSEPQLAELLRAFFRMDDSNAEARYRFFYAQIAPSLRLYQVGVGEVFHLKALTREGYVRSVSLRLYGTFEFAGLEKAALAGVNNLMDMMSFRDLYGYLTPDAKQEIEALRSSAGDPVISPDDAEASLFGGAAAEDLVAESQQSVIDVPAKVAAAEQRTEELLERTYSQEEVESGVFLNAAVLLEDPTQLDATLRQITQAARREGLSIKAVSWREAAGLLGNFVGVVRGALYFAVSLIFLVTLLILNNAMVMGTLRRKQEVGTMRALGAQRHFILAMILAETGVMGLGFGLLGAALSGLLVGWLGKTGIPAFNEYIAFFFAGERLFPTVSVGHAVGALAIVLGLSMVSTLYPALLAARVSPREAMQGED